MTTLEQIIELERRYLLQTYNRYPGVFDRGKGVFLYDFEGKTYLDFVSGLGVNALGHAHPRIVKTIREQAAQPGARFKSVLPRIPGAAGGETVLICRGLDRAFFSNSGTEAIEGSIKLARLAGHRAGGEAKSRLVGAGRVLSWTYLWRDVADRAGQTSQGIRAAARRRHVCPAATISKLCARP